MRQPDDPTQSPWMSYPMPARPPLAGDLRTEVCVVGAGIAGLSVAYLCAKKGMKVAVLDDGPVAGGMASRTTAHLRTWIEGSYRGLEQLHGEDDARLAAETHRAAIDAIEAICRHESIDCDFASIDGYLFLDPDGDPETLVDEHAAALRAGVEGVAWADRAPMDGVDTGRCLRIPRQGQVHPTRYAAGLVRAIERLGGRVHGGVPVESVHGGETPGVHVAGGRRVDCKAVVVATPAPLGERHAIQGQQVPYTTYAIALRVPRGTVATALQWDLREPSHDVRLDKPDGEVLIVGGEDHETGPADDATRRFARLELWARERFPMAREVLHRWSGQGMRTLDPLACIGRDPGERNVFVATGDSRMAMTHGTIAGILVTELIHGSEVSWEHLYDPRRFLSGQGGPAVRSRARLENDSAGDVRIPRHDRVNRPTAPPRP